MNSAPSITSAHSTLRWKWREPDGPVDVLGSIMGVGEFEQVRLGAIEVELFGRRCRVICLDDLIRAKEALGREKDLLAVKELKAIREKQAKP